ncbi:hypothetical protein [Phormidium nigroviride]
MKPRAGKAFQPLLPDLQGSRLKALLAFSVHDVIVAASNELRQQVMH